MSFGDDIISIQIRADLFVRIHGLPWDMTQAEAAKIAAVVMAYSAEMARKEGA